jgi:hypothetical protein
LTLNEGAIVKKIDDLGFETGIIYETIITSMDRLGRPHAATMGALFEKSGGSVLFRIKAYPSSKTGENLLLTPFGVLNVTDPELLVEAALDLCAEFDYAESNSIKVPRLSRATAWIEFRVINATRRDELVEFTCSPLYVGHLEVKPKPYTRAVFALIEAAIHASRIKPYKEMGLSDKATELYESAKKYLEIVERVAPNSRYALIARKIREKYL